MYLTLKEFRKIEMALRLLPQGEEFEKLTKEQQATIIDAEVALFDAYKKGKEVSKRNGERIREKRKTDKDYGRGKSKYIKIKDRVKEN